MITFTKLGQYGRLGNQLFQYAILLVIRDKLGYEIKIPNINDKEWHGQKCLLNNFKITADILSKNDKIKYKFIENNNNNFRYDKKIFEIKDNTDILGFFQNNDYYKNHFDLIKKELTLKDEIVNFNKERLKKIKSIYNGYEIISLHLRRGDSDLNMYGKTLHKNSRWYRYFEKAKDMFKNKKVKFLVFTGGQRKKDSSSIDYKWCYDNLKGDEFIYSNDNVNDVINDFSLMQQCDHNILSPISTLSWWVGYLNDKKSIIIAPEKYYFLNKKMDDNFYPNKFKLI